MKNYEIQVHLTNQMIILLRVKAENNEMALNKVQGMIHEKDGWIHLEDTNDINFRVLSRSISHISCDTRQAMML